MNKKKLLNVTAVLLFLIFVFLLFNSVAVVSECSITDPPVDGRDGTKIPLGGGEYLCQGRPFDC